jgi:hypothetical protein
VSCKRALCSGRDMPTKSRYADQSRHVGRRRYSDLYGATLCRMSSRRRSSSPARRASASWTACPSRCTMPRRQRGQHSAPAARCGFQLCQTQGFICGVLCLPINLATQTSMFHCLRGQMFTSLPVKSSDACQRTAAALCNLDMHAHCATCNQGASIRQICDTAVIYCTLLHCQRDKTAIV